MIRITSATLGATIYYTTNGTDPSSSNGQAIASGSSVAVYPTYDGVPLRAIARKAGQAQYDPNGNLTSYKSWVYTYDAQNRLRLVHSNQTLIAEYYYDGKNRQIARSLNDEVRFSVWDGWELIEEYGSNRATAYLQGATGVIKSWTHNSVIYYYQDKLGSTTHIANASGTLLESFHYDLYGRPTETSAYGVIDLYAGERWVSALGLYDLRNRFMSPELGRFLQADPIGFKGDPSNLYRYCHNDPENFSDPMGLASTDPNHYSPLISKGGGEWVKDSNGMTAWDIEQRRDQAAGLIMSRVERVETENGGKKGVKSPHEEAIAMLATETRRRNVSQTGIITDGPPYRVGPVTEKKVLINPNHISRGYKDITLETLRWRGGKALFIVHYHAQGGKKYGEPTQDHDLEMLKQAPMYFTNRSWAAQGKYLILREGHPPEEHVDPRIIPPRK